MTSIYIPNTSGGWDQLAQITGPQGPQGSQGTSIAGWNVSADSSLVSNVGKISITQTGIIQGTYDTMGIAWSNSTSDPTSSKSYGGLYAYPPLSGTLKITTGNNDTTFGGLVTNNIYNLTNINMTSQSVVSWTNSTTNTVSVKDIGICRSSDLPNTLTITQGAYNTTFGNLKLKDLTATGSITSNGQYAVTSQYAMSIPTPSGTTTGKYLSNNGTTVSWTMPTLSAITGGIWTLDQTVTQSMGNIEIDSEYGDIKAISFHGTLYGTLYGNASTATTANSIRTGIALSPLLSAGTIFLTSGKLYISNGSNYVAFEPMPDQSGNSGKLLTTNGSATMWGHPDIITSSVSSTSALSLTSAINTDVNLITSGTGKAKYNSNEILTDMGFPGIISINGNIITIGNSRSTTDTSYIYMDYGRAGVYSITSLPTFKISSGIDTVSNSGSGVGVGTRIGFSYHDYTEANYYSTSQVNLRKSEVEILSAYPTTDGGASSISDVTKIVLNGSDRSFKFYCNTPTVGTQSYPTLNITQTIIETPCNMLIGSNPIYPGAGLGILQANKIKLQNPYFTLEVSVDAGSDALKISTSNINMANGNSQINYSNTNGFSLYKTGTTKANLNIDTLYTSGNITATGSITSNGQYAVTSQYAMSIPTPSGTTTGKYLSNNGTTVSWTMPTLSAITGNTLSVDFSGNLLCAFTLAGLQSDGDRGYVYFRDIIHDIESRLTCTDDGFIESQTYYSGSWHHAAYYPNESSVTSSISTHNNSTNAHGGKLVSSESATKPTSGLALWKSDGTLLSAGTGAAGTAGNGIGKLISLKIVNNATNLGATELNGSYIKQIYPEESVATTYYNMSCDSNGMPTITKYTPAIPSGMDMGIVLTEKSVYADRLITRYPVPTEYAANVIPYIAGGTTATSGAMQMVAGVTPNMVIPAAYMYPGSIFRLRWFISRTAITLSTASGGNWRLYPVGYSGTVTLGVPAQNMPAGTTHNVMQDMECVVVDDGSTYSLLFFTFSGTTTSSKMTGISKTADLSCFLWSSNSVSGSVGVNYTDSIYYFQIFKVN